MTRLPRTPNAQPGIGPVAAQVARDERDAQDERGARDDAAGPVVGWPVLVPRPSGAASPAVAALAAAGAHAVVVPLVETVPPDDPTDLDDLLLALGSGWYGWLVVTSAAAVPVLESRAEEVERDLASLVRAGGARVAAVGPGTARALEAAGVPVDLLPGATASAEGLLAAWPEVAEPARVLFPRGDLAAPTLAEGLRDRGWDVDDVVAYRTVPAAPAPDEVRADWTAGVIRAALLTSASTARALVDALGAPPPGTLLVAIGPSTAAEAARLGLPLAAVAAQQSMTGLVEALVAAARAAAEGTPAPRRPGAVVTPHPPRAAHPERAEHPEHPEHHERPEHHAHPEPKETP